jgi:hypothetical protein
VPTRLPDERVTIAAGVALLPSVEAVDALAPETLPALIAGLAALQARAAARLAVPGPMLPIAEPPAPDVLLDAREVARIARRSVSWVRRHGHKLPGFSQPSGKRCKVAWSRRALEAWAGGEPSPLTNGRARA